MRRIWRITTVRQKLLFIVIGYAAVALLFFALRTWVLYSGSWLYSALNLIVVLSYTLLGVRVFRGYLEPVTPPRAWWRWTGRPKAGFWLGSLNLFALAGAVQGFWPPRGVALHLPVVIVGALESLLPAFGYLNSSFRLHRHPELWSQQRIKSAAGGSVTRPSAEKDLIGSIEG